MTSQRKQVWEKKEVKREKFDERRENHCREECKNIKKTNEPGYWQKRCPLRPLPIRISPSRFYNHSFLVVRILRLSNYSDRDRQLKGTGVDNDVLALPATLCGSGGTILMPIPLPDHVCSLVSDPPPTRETFQVRLPLNFVIHTTWHSCRVLE